MKMFRRITKYLLILMAGIAVFCYAFYLFILPNILMSSDKITQYEDFISQKIGIPFVIKGLKVKTYPDLSFKISVKKVSADTKNNINLAHIDDLEYRANLLNIKHGKLSSAYIYGDIPAVKDNIKFTPNKEQKPLDLSFFPKTNIKKAYIKVSDKTNIQIDYIKSKSHFGKITTNLLAKINNPYTKTPVIIGQNGSIVYNNKLGFENFSIKLDDSKVYITGGTSGLKIKGKSLPVRELERSFLYFYKLKFPNKRNFIENFSDFYGKLDIDLTYKNGTLEGNCIAHDLGAKFSNFKFPVHLPYTKFIFTKDKKITADTKGTFGGEPVTTNFLLTGLMTHDLNVWGDVHSPFTNSITKKYFPMIRISGIADADVKYHTHNQKVDVWYTLKMNKGYNLLSDYGNLDNTDKVRIISMHTVKQGNPMKIQDYNYSILTPNGKKKLLYGEGMFDKIKGHYKLTSINLKSNGKVPLKYIKSFLKDYVKNGTFDTNLSLDVLNKKLDGSMNLYDVSHEDFLYLKNTNLKILNDNITLASNGSFYGSPYSAKANIANNFKNGILIHNIDAHLNSFYVQRGKLTNIPQSFTKNTPKKSSIRKKIKIDVEQGRAVVDRIYGRKFDVRNVNLQGSLKNDTADFIIPNAQYANGVLTAKGVYNISTTYSNIQFFASDIDSNTVVTNFFKLPDQVSGKAFATLHVITGNKLNDIKAKATFAIADGYLPKIANQEFVIGGKNKKKKTSQTQRHKLLSKIGSKLNIKVTLSKLINIDFSKPKDLYTNIYGSFNIDNEYVSDIKLFSKNDMLSFFLEGDYNIEDQCASLALWGKSNKTRAKTIRILKIPINLIYKIVFKTEHTHSQYEDKIKQIPAIKTSVTDEINTFRVSADGNLNDTSHLKIIMKNIK